MPILMKFFLRSWFENVVLLTLSLKPNCSCTNHNQFSQQEVLTFWSKSHINFSLPHLEAAKKSNSDIASPTNNWPFVPNRNSNSRFWIPTIWLPFKRFWIAETRPNIQFGSYEPTRPTIFPGAKVILQNQSNFLCSTDRGAWFLLNLPNLTSQMQLNWTVLCETFCLYFSFQFLSMIIPFVLSCYLNTPCANFRSLKSDSKVSTEIKICAILWIKK